MRKRRMLLLWIAVILVSFMGCKGKKNTEQNEQKEEVDNIQMEEVGYVENNIKLPMDWGIYGMAYTTDGLEVLFGDYGFKEVNQYAKAVYDKKKEDWIITSLGWLTDTDWSYYYEKKGREYKGSLNNFQWGSNGKWYAVFEEEVWNKLEDGNAHIYLTNTQIVVLDLEAETVEALDVDIKLSDPTDFSDYPEDAVILKDLDECANVMEYYITDENDIFVKYYGETGILYSPQADPEFQKQYVYYKNQMVLEQPKSDSEPPVVSADQMGFDSLNGSGIKNGYYDNQLFVPIKKNDYINEINVQDVRGGILGTMPYKTTSGTWWTLAGNANGIYIVDKGIGITKVAIGEEPETLVDASEFRNLRMMDPYNFVVSEEGDFYVLLHSPDESRLVEYVPEGTN